MEEQKVLKGQHWTITTYLDNDEDLRIAEYIKLNYKYARIIHDKDIEEDTGEIKKAHMHSIFTFENERTLEVIAKEINVDKNRLQKIKRWKSQVRYLTHIDYPKKYQYEIKDIETNIDNLEEYFIDREKSEGKEMGEILKFIYSVDRHIYIHEVLEFALNNNYYSTFRRSGGQMMKIIDEHNRLYLEKRSS